MAIEDKDETAQSAEDWLIQRARRIQAVAQANAEAAVTDQTEIDAQAEAKTLAPAFGKAIFAIPHYKDAVFRGHTEERVRGKIPDPKVSFPHNGFQYEAEYEETCDLGVKDPWRIRVFISRYPKNLVSEREDLLVIWVQEGRQNDANKSVVSYQSADVFEPSPHGSTFKKDKLICLKRGQGILTHLQSPLNQPAHQKPFLEIL